MFSSILFVDGFPVHFLVQKKGKTFLFQPISNPYRKAARNIKVTMQEGGLAICGTDDENLVDQIIEDLYEHIGL